MKMGFAIVFVFFALFVFGSGVAEAATRTWTGSTNQLWNVDANWGGTKPVAGDDLVFPVSATNFYTNNDYPADTSFNSITIEGTGYTLAGNRISLAGGSITSNISGGSNQISLAMILTADLNIAVTNSNESLYITGIISESGGARTLTKTSPGTLGFGFQSNTFTGGTVIKEGTILLGSSNSLSSGSVTIGDSAGGSLDASLIGNVNGGAYTNAIVLASNTTGTLSIGAGSGATTYFDGGITGTNDLTITTDNSAVSIRTNTLNVAGEVVNQSSGTGSVNISAVIGSNVTEVIQDSTTSIMNLTGNNSSYTGGVTVKKGRLYGTLANSLGTSASTVTIGDTSGSDDATLQVGNVTHPNPIVVASGSSGTATILSDLNPILSGGITLNKDLIISNFYVGGRTITISGGVTGTGNLTVASTGASSVVTFSTTAVNMTGTFTNASAGGNTNVTAVIGTNVTEVIQDSTVSTLILSGSNTFTGGLTVKKGIVQGNVSNAFGGSGTGTITLGDSSGSSDASIRAGTSAGFANPITVASGSSGTLSITTNAGAPVFSGAVTLNNNLTLSPSNSSFTMSGGMTGTGNLIISSSNTSSVLLSTGSLNMTGTITNSGSGSGLTTITSVIGTNITGVVQDSSTSGLALQATNTFNSGLTIKKGYVLARSVNGSLGGSGTGAITLGDISGSSDATLASDTGGSLSFANPITVASGSSGNRILAIYGSGSPTFSGAITLNADLIMGAVAGGSLNVTGGITGNGNVVASTTSTGGINITTTSVNNTGTITNVGPGTGATTISAVIGSNVTGLTQNSSSRTITLSGDGSTINGDVNILAGTLALSGTTGITVGGDWNNAGTFTANSSTVTFSSGTHEITGANTFYNFTASTNNTLSFEENVTQTINNNFSCTGTAGNTITIDSLSAGTQATLSKSSGTVDCDYLLLTDSNATGGATWNAGSNSIGYTNVTGWDGYITVPDAPTGLGATVGNTQIALSWTAPADNGGSAVTDYVIEYKLTSEPTTWSIFADGTSASTNGSVTGLTNGLSYDFRVSTVNIAGQGDPSDTVSATPATVPGAPTIGTATPGDEMATVTFSAPASDGGSAITSYTASSSPGGLTGTGASSPINVTGLTNGVAYTFTVTATNAQGTSSPSAASNSVTPSQAPDAPTALSATPGNTQVALEWVEPGFDGGATITDYVVEYKLTSEPVTWSVFSDGTSDATSTTVTGLTNGLSYDFRVSAVNSSGQGDPSDDVSSTPYTVPGAPTIGTATGGNAQATVTFSAPASNGGSAITGYTVTSSPGGFTGTGASSPITVTGLSNGTAYTFTVTATNAAGTGAASEASNSVTPATVPGAPTNVVAVAGNAQATVSFDAPASNGGAAITSYMVSSDPGGFSNSGASSPIVVSGLTNGSSYTFAVSATNSAGTGPTSTPSAQITLPTAPGAPTNLAASVLGSSISLSWSAPASNGGSAITDYVIEYQLTTGGDWAVFSDGVNTNTTGTVTGLSNDNSYDFRVSAVNIAGQGSASGVAVATPGEPAQVLIQSFTDLTITSIGTAVRITNEGAIAYEYQYTWCITDAVDNLCGGGNDEFSSTAAKLIQPAEDWDTTLSSTLEETGTYWFHIEVTYGSASSTANQSFTSTATFPDAPTIGTATAGNAQASVTFSAPASNGGSAITSYTVTSNPGGLTGTGASSPITVTGLTNGTPYTFTVTATNAVGTGPASSASNSVTPATVPNPPTGLTATPGNQSVALSWTAPADNGGSAITDYVVEYKVSSDSVWVVFSDGTSTETSTTVTGLTNDVSYDFRVSAVNAIGQSSVNSTTGTASGGDDEDEDTPLSSGGSAAPRRPQSGDSNVTQGNIPSTPSSQGNNYSAGGRSGASPSDGSGTEDPDGITNEASTVPTFDPIQAVVPTKDTVSFWAEKIGILLLGLSLGLVLSWLAYFVFRRRR